MVDGCTIEDIPVKVLTPFEIRELLWPQKPHKKEESEVNLTTTINLLLPDGVDADAIVAATGLKISELADMDTNDLVFLQRRVGAKNPFFLTMWQRLVEAGKEITKQHEKNSTD